MIFKYLTYYYIIEQSKSLYHVYVVPCLVSQEARHDSFIGFSVYKTITQAYEAGDTISFDAVLIDEGSYYSSILNR